MENLLCGIMKCGYLDLEFLNELIEKYNIDLDFEDTLLTYGYTNIKDLNINIFIYETLEKIKNMFLEDNKENIEDLGFNIYNLDYEIFTNYLDSHLWFNDNEIDNLYQNWRK